MVVEWGPSRARVGARSGPPRFLTEASWVSLIWGPLRRSGYASRHIEASGVSLSPSPTPSSILLILARKTGVQVLIPALSSGSRNDLEQVTPSLWASLPLSSLSRRYFLGLHIIPLAIAPHREILPPPDIPPGVSQVLTSSSIFRLHCPTLVRRSNKLGS